MSSVASGIQCHPEESGAFGGRKLGQLRRPLSVFGEALLAGHADQVAVEVVGPCVVRAGEPAWRLPQPVGDLRLAVQADVVERLDRSVGCRVSRTDRPITVFVQ